MKIFILLSRFPYPTEKGDKLRAYHQIRSLSEHHEVHLFCLTEELVAAHDVDRLKAYCTSINVHTLSKSGIYARLARALFSRLPFQVHYFLDRKAKSAIQELILGLEPELIYAQLVRTAEFVRHLSGLPRVVDLMDALGEGMLRMSREASFPRSWLYLVEHRRLQRYEAGLLHDIDAATIISEQDRQLIFSAEKGKISVVPNGVDTTFFQPSDKPSRALLCFVGNLSYEPNIYAVEFIVHEVLPALRRSIPGANVVITGAHPTKAVKDLASDVVEIQGWVDDVRQGYEAGSFMIAPMEINTGLQNKILEAMAMGKLCFTSSLANNAVQAVDGIHLLTCESPADYVQKIRWALEHPDEAGKIARAGRRFVEENYGWESVNRGLLHILKGVKERRELN